MNEMSIEYPQPQLLMENALLVDTVFFNFEDDFVERNIRCIPMIVRFKMDKAGIKLKLAEWSRFSTGERIELAMKPCGDEREATVYHEYLAWLVKRYTDTEATVLPVDQWPGWTKGSSLPVELEEKLNEFNWFISSVQWNELADLQRFALLKLCRAGHESKNFPKAMKEFGLLPAKQNFRQLAD